MKEKMTKVPFRNRPVARVASAMRVASAVLAARVVRAACAVRVKADIGVLLKQMAIILLINSINKCLTEFLAITNKEGGEMTIPDDLPEGFFRGKKTKCKQRCLF